jgi:biopolymer transport protein ExbB/TolQ
MEGNVSNGRQRNLFTTIAGSLGWPLLSGMAACVGFYVLIRQGIIRNELILRYVCDHEIEYVETALFFVGFAALAIKLLSVLMEYAIVGRLRLTPVPEGGQPIEDCPILLDSLRELPRALRNSRLGRRLRKALNFVRLSGTVDQLDDAIANLADEDRAHQHEDYALTRIIIWAIPMLGFLGTVIGITAALAGLTKGSMIDSGAAMDGLVASLSIAFDTTALALTLSIVLMFLQFLIHRTESELLKVVDARAESELLGRFQRIGSSQDPHLASLDRMSTRVVAATERLVGHQVKLWQATIDEAHERWCQLSEGTGKQIENALAGALDRTVKTHTAELVKAENAAAERSQRYSEQLRSALIESAKVMKDQQAELVRQGETMARAIEATAKVAGLQDALNQNLNSLAGSKNFEDTVMSLSAAIHLLNTRLGHGETASAVDLSAASSGVREKAA